MVMWTVGLVLFCFLKEKMEMQHPSSGFTLVQRPLLASGHAALHSPSSSVLSPPLSAVNANDNKNCFHDCNTVNRDDGKTRSKKLGTIEVF